MNCGKWVQVSLLFMLALSLALPATAQVRSPLLADSQAPGSVIVFPKFLTGTVGGLPRSEFEIGITCPKNLDGTPGVCVEGTEVKLRAHWVCPGSQDPASKYICAETNFDLRSTVTGTIRINPGNIGSVTQRVPAPPCPAGYLIAWVINTSDQPIKADALVGTGILREVEGATSAYNGVPIQASPDAATGSLIATLTSPFTGKPSLPFTGSPGQYQAVSGKVQGTVAYDSSTSVTALTLLTLDILSNRPNYPTFVDFNFYSENEVLLSTSHEFICWTQVTLSEINPNLTDTGLSPKGLVVSEQAFKVPVWGIFDLSGPATLLGIVETLTGDGAYSYSLYNNSQPITTVFVQ